MSYNWKCCSFYPNNFDASALFLSEALKGFEYFRHHADGVAHGVESATKVHLLEVEPDVSVHQTSRHVDILAFEHMRIADDGIGRGSALEEREMFVRVATQQALVNLSYLCDAVEAQVGFDVRAELRVAEPSAIASGSRFSFSISIFGIRFPFCGSILIRCDALADGLGKG